MGKDWPDLKCAIRKSMQKPFAQLFLSLENSGPSVLSASSGISL